jgi:hypothetical protein
MRASVAVLSFFLVGCGRQDLDLLVRSDGSDRCGDYETEAECGKQASSGCSYQPNEVGCVSTDPSCQPGQCRSGDPFVRPTGRSFSLNGAPFRFVGVSSWALVPIEKCKAVNAEDREIWLTQTYDALVPSRTKVARLFAFQKAAGPTGDDFTLFDSSVRAARRAGIRLILTLDHGQGECSKGPARDEAWYSAGYRVPDEDYVQSYRDYVAAVVRRYSGEPTVLGYTLLQNLGIGGAEPQTLSDFIMDVGGLIHQASRNQLVSLDLYGDPTPSYVDLQQLPVVDYVDFDDYDNAQPEEPLRADLLEALSPLDKPVVVGEGAFDIRVGDGRIETDEELVEAIQRRASRARGRMTQWKNAGLSGALLWAYEPGWLDASEEFDARPDDPLLQPGGVVAQAPW